MKNLDFVTCNWGWGLVSRKKERQERNVIKQQLHRLPELDIFFINLSSPVLYFMLCAQEKNRQYERPSRKKRDKEVRDTPYLKYLAMRSDWILPDEDGSFQRLYL